MLYISNFMRVSSIHNSKNIQKIKSFEFGHENVPDNFIQVVLFVLNFDI